MNEYTVFSCITYSIEYRIYVKKTKPYASNIKTSFVST